MRVFVFFNNCHGAPLWSRFCKEGFKHCFLIKEQVVHGIPILIRLETITKLILNDVELLDIDTVIRLYKAATPEATVLAGETTGEQPDRFNQLIHLNCVSTVRKALGIDDWKVVSPHQLYKKLLTLGFKEI